MIIIIPTIKYGSTYYNTFTMGVYSNYMIIFFIVLREFSGLLDDGGLYDPVDGVATMSKVFEHFVNTQMILVGTCNTPNWKNPFRRYRARFSYLLMAKHIGLIYFSNLCCISSKSSSKISTSIWSRTEINVIIYQK